MPELVILVGASGVGKTTLQRWLLEQHPARFERIVGATTRPPREGEADGRDCHFLSDDEFSRREAAGAFIETASFGGARYGTLRTELDKPGILLHVCEMEGAEAFRAAVQHCTVVALVPPDDGELLRRLRQRWPGEANADKVAARMDLAPAMEAYVEAQRGTPGFHVVASNADAPDVVLCLLGQGQALPLCLRRPYP